MIGQQSLDSDPTTVVDWSQGSWLNYEDSNGNLTDSGGIDGSIRIIDDNSELFPSVNPPAPQPTTPPSGGGGSMGWFLLMLLTTMAYRKRNKILL